MKIGVLVDIMPGYNPSKNQVNPMKNGQNDNFLPTKGQWPRHDIPFSGS